jgi:hypothetical protein
MNEELNKEQEKDRFICEKLNWRCSSPLSVMGGLMWEYPDFITEAGRVQLLKLLMAAPENSNMVELRNILGSWRNTTLWFINPEFMTDDTGRFRDAVFEWLGGEG